MTWIPVILLIFCSPTLLAFRLHYTRKSTQRAISRGLIGRSSLKHARTDGPAKAAALEEFRTALAPQSTEIIAGESAITCGSTQYFGPVKGIGTGAHGVTVLVHRDSKTGPEVVLKLWKGSEFTTEENLNHECDVLEELERHSVPGVVRCEARCMHNSRQIIIESPFEKNVQSFDGPLSTSYFSNEATALQAVEKTFYIAWSMLEAGVANIDQGQNILYSKDGSVRFIDMGIASKLVETPDDDNERIYDFVQGFLLSILGKVPIDYWKDNGAHVFAIVEKLGLPVLPESVQARRHIDFSELLVEIFVRISERYAHLHDS